MRAVDPTPMADGHAQQAEETTVIISLDELAFLSNAITESLEAIESWEFDSRLGKTPDEARLIRGQIGAILDRLDN